MYIIEIKKLLYLKVRRKIIPQFAEKSQRSSKCQKNPSLVHACSFHRVYQILEILEPRFLIRLLSSSSYFIFLQICQKLILLQPMNKSIMKTRNELERITYKINQLKNKYAGENYVQFGQEYPANLVVTPQQHKNQKNKEKSMHDKEKPESRNRREEEQFILKDSLSPNIHNYQSKNNGNRKSTKFIHKDSVDMKSIQTLQQNRKSVPVVSSTLEIPDEKITECTNKKQMKNLKIELSSYIDKTISSKIKSLHEELTNNQKEKHLEEKLKAYIDELLGNKMILTDSEKEEEDEQIRKYNACQIRLTKIQEEFTNCISHFDQLFQKVESIEEQFVQNCQKSPMNNLTESPNKLIVEKDQLIEMIAQGQDQLTEQFSKQYQEIKESIEHLRKQTHEKIKKNNFSEQIGLLRKELQKNRVAQQEQAHLIQQISGQCQQRVEDVMNRFKVTVENKIESITKRFVQNDQKSNNSGDLVTESMIRLQQQIETLVETKIQSVKNENLSEISCLKDRIEQEFTSKNEGIAELWLKLDQIDKKVGKVSESIEGQISQMYESLEAKNCSQRIENIEGDLRSINVKLSEQLTAHSEQITNNMRQLIQTNEQRLTELSLQVQQLSTKEPKQIFSQPTSFSTNQLQDMVKKINDEVQDKLNSFESDINDTIKLLYEDIEARVSEMINSNHPHQPQQNPQQSDIENLLEIQIGKLREELSGTVAQQIDKLGDLLERTVEEIETKMEKLDGNFGYIHERMSRIQYQNAVYKDTMGLKEKMIGCQQIPRGTSDRNEHDNSLLNLLGHLSNNKDMGSLGMI